MAADLPSSASEISRLRAELAAAQAARQQAEVRATYYQHLFEQPRQAAVIVRNGHYADCNAMALDLLGLRHREQLLGQPIGTFSAPVQPDGRPTAERLTDALEQAHRLGWTRFSWLGRRVGGEEFWEDILVTAIKLEGEVMYHITWEDTSDRHPSPGGGYESENRLQLALAATASGVWICRLPTRTVYADQRARVLLGVTEAITAQSELLARIHPADLPELRASFRRALRRQQPFEVEFRLHHPTEGVRYLVAMGQVQFNGHGQPQRLTGLLRDVTARHRTRHELSRKNELLQRMLHHLPLLLGRFDRTGRLLELQGSGLQRLPGAAVSVGQPATDLLPGMHVPVAQVLAGESVRFIARAGSPEAPVFMQFFGFFDESQECGVIFSIDVTESELIKERLRTEKEFTDSLLNHSLDAIAACDAVGHVTAWNRLMEQLTTAPASQVLGQPLPEHPFFGRDTVPGSALRTLLANPLNPQRNLPFRHETREYEASFLPLQAPAGGPGVLAVVRDVTQRNHLANETTRLHLRRQQEILAAVLEAQEAERRRIAEGLHNGVGQLLYAAKLGLPATAAVQPTRILLEEAIRATRTISFELTPGVLADFGLQTALEELFKRLPPHLPVHLHVQGLPNRLPAAIEMAAYRIVQELLNNILRHAHATEATLRATYQPGQLLLVAEDNGVGFDPGPLAAEPAQGMGLASIRHRVELLLGELHLQAAPGQGTRLQIMLPCLPEFSA